MPNYGGTSSGMDTLDSWGGGSVGNFGSGGFDMGGNADFGGYTSFGDWGGSSIDNQIADAVAGVAAASLAGGDAGGWADPSGGFGTVDVGGGGWDFGGLGDPLGGAEGWGSSVADMVGSAASDALGGGGGRISVDGSVGGGFGSTIAGITGGIGASGFGSGGGGGGGWDTMPSGEPVASTGFSDLFTYSGRQPNIGPGVQNMSKSAFSDVQVPGSIAASVPEMQTVSNAFKSMNTQLPAGVTSQPGTPNMYGTPQELGPKIQDRISPDIAKALPAPTDVMEPSNPALAGFSYGQPKPDKITDRIEPDKNFQNPNIKTSIPGVTDLAPPDPVLEHIYTHNIYGFEPTSMPAVFGIYQKPKDQSRIASKDSSRLNDGELYGYASIAGGYGAGMGGTRTVDVPQKGADSTYPYATYQPAPSKPQQTLFGAPVDILSKSVRRDMNQPTDRYGNVLDVGSPNAGVNVYSDGFVEPVMKSEDKKKNTGTATTEPYPTHAYPPYYPTWPYVSGYAPGGLAPWSWFQSLYAQA